VRNFSWDGAFDRKVSLNVSFANSARPASRVGRNAGAGHYARKKECAVAVRMKSMARVFMLLF
jgi:hypothetical protein